MIIEGIRIKLKDKIKEPKATMSKTKKYKAEKQGVSQNTHWSV